MFLGQRGMFNPHSGVRSGETRKPLALELESTMIDIELGNRRNCICGEGTSFGKCSLSCHDDSGDSSVLVGTQVLLGMREHAGRSVSVQIMQPLMSHGLHDGTAGPN